MIAPKMPVLVNSKPRKVIGVSGIKKLTKKYEEMAVNTIEPQFPMFNAACTLLTLNPALSEIRTKKVPIIEKIIPKPAINIGNKMGAIPP